MIVRLNLSEEKETLPKDSEISIGGVQKVSEIRKKFPDKNIVLDYEKELTELPLKELKALKLVLRLFSAPNSELVQKVKQSGIPFFFAYPACDIDTFISMRDFGVREIFVSGSLFFDLPQISIIKKDALIRIAPDTCSTNGFIHSNSAIGTWVRPEDLLRWYAPFVDIVEFAQKDKEETLYHIYFEDKSWEGKLKNLIPEITEDVRSSYIYPTLAWNRLNCKQRCLYEINPHCDLCARCFKLGEKVKEIKDVHSTR